MQKTPRNILLTVIAFLVVSSAAVTVPAEFQDLYPVLQSELSSYIGTVHSVWKGSKSPVLFGAELIPADDYDAIYNAARNNQLNSYYDQFMTPYINGLQTVGVKSVKFLIHFPLLYQPFYTNYLGDTNGTAYNNLIAFYQKLVNDLHGRGIAVIIQSQVQPAGNGPLTGDPLNLAAYYQSLSFSQHIQGRAQNALTIALQLKPDILNVSPEPDTEGGKSGRAELMPRPENPNFAGNVQQIQSTILRTLTAANIPGLHTRMKLAVGMGTWERDLPTILRNETSMAGVDVIDIHVHLINTIRTKNFLTEILTIADAAHAAGKATGMDEDWEFKQRDSELSRGGYGRGGVPMSVIDARDHWSFWAPVDQAFLEAMVDTAYYEKMLYFDASEPNQFFAYLDYSNTPGCDTNSFRGGAPSLVCSPKQWNAASYRAVYQSLGSSPATLTSTGAFYRKLIQANP